MCVYIGCYKDNYNMSCDGTTQTMKNETGLPVS